MSQDALEEVKRMRTEQDNPKADVTNGGVDDLFPHDIERCHENLDLDDKELKEMGHDTIKEAREIRRSLGDHEVEVTCGGEADLHQHYKTCEKNPGHSNFTPIKDFKKEHLPPGYQDDVIVDWIRSEADLTCLLQLEYTRNGTTSPVSWTGTGWVHSVNMYTVKDKVKCVCDRCTSLGIDTPRENWAKVEIRTAYHIVKNSEGAKYGSTTCRLLYDTGTTSIKQCPKLTGLKVEYTDIESDFCIMTCVTHDLDLVFMLHKMNVLRLINRKKVMDMYRPCMNEALVSGVFDATNPKPCPVVVISHPHGCNKQISIGNWKDRRLYSKKVRRNKDGWDFDCIGTRYIYDAATCPGSSGAPVIRLMDPERWWMGADYHPHSRGTGNNNKSGVMEEIVSRPYVSQDMLLNSMSDSAQHNLKKEHLPPGYRDHLIFDWIRAEADLTCRLSVDYTSELRPTYHPIDKSVLYPFSQDRGSHWMRVGSGKVLTVEKHTEEDNKACECNDCNNPSTHTPHKVWGKVYLITACHVIFSDDEARRTKCHFGYDTSTTVRSRDCIQLTGFKVKGQNILQDWCIMSCVTHDMDTINKLWKMLCHCEDLRKTVRDKYSYRSNKNISLNVPRVPCLTQPKPEPVVIISHPHGCSKQVSVGMWTHRETETKKFKHQGWEIDYEVTSYTYNAHTCPGSSGSVVIRLSEEMMVSPRLWLNCHVHSEGSKDNNDNNTSASAVESVSRPLVSVNNVKTD